MYKREQKTASIIQNNMKFPLSLLIEKGPCDWNMFYESFSRWKTFWSSVNSKVTVWSKSDTKIMVFGHGHFIVSNTNKAVKYYVFSHFMCQICLCVFPSNF